MQNKIAQLLKQGKVGVLPTDTIYGIHGRALNKDAVERIYKVRGRDRKKPFIILISSINDLALFQIKVDNETKKILKKVWPGKVSVVLRRGKKSLALRLPDYKPIINVLKQTGPLVSTSVNPEGKKPASTIEEAKAYFGDKLDFYVNAGKLESEPSTVIKIKKGKAKVLRQGVVII